MSRSPAREVHQIAAQLNAGRRGEMRSRAVEFHAFPARRLTLTGVRYLLHLHVWPDTGFDDFEWEACRRSWVGTVTTAVDVSSRANAVLDAYAEGDIPPRAAFPLNPQA